MSITERVTVGALATIIVVFLATGACCLVLTVSGLRLIDTASATLVSVNAPCTSFHGSASCGPIAQLSQTEKDIGILASQGAEQVKQSGKLIDATTANLNEVGNGVGGLVKHLEGTADAITTAAEGTTESVNQVASAALPVERNAANLVNHLDVETAPLVTHADLMITHLDAVAKNPQIPAVLNSFAQVTSNAAVITANGVVMSHDAVVEEQKFVYPKPSPWWKRAGGLVLRGGELTYDFVR